MEESFIKKLKNQLQSGRKADYLEVLHKYKDKLSKIPLPYDDTVDTAQAFRDTVREDVMLNGVRFVGEHRMEAFVAAIKRIVAQASPDKNRCLQVSDRIMRSCSRTSSGADAYFTLESIFGSPSLLLKPRQEDPPPLDIKLGFDNNTLKCRISTINVFGIYRHEDIESLMETGNDNAASMEPWIPIDTKVIESIDLEKRGHKTKRYLSIRTSEGLPKIQAEILELF